MSTIKVKVVGYEEASNSVLVSFASDETQSQNPEDYSPVAVQVSATDDIEKIKRDLALVGIQVVREQVNKERIVTDIRKVDEIKALVGQEFSFDELELDTSTSAFPNEVVL
jgi:hypothetical protein